MKTLTIQDKIDHVNRCEFHNGIKEGVCPTVSIKEAENLRNHKSKRKEDK